MDIWYNEQIGVQHARLPLGRKTALLENRLYAGDNLPILESLVEEAGIAGKVKLVYIDPPFGTGQDFRTSDEQGSTISRPKNGTTAYSDRLVGDAYLEFLLARLVRLHRILANDGSIYVHIDTKVGHFVKILLDRVFGQQHFRSDITRVKCNPKNFPRQSYGNIKDIILFYTKSKRAVWNYPCEPYTQEQTERLFHKIDKQGRRYTTTPVHAPGETQNGPTGRPWRDMKPPPGRHWRYSPDVLERLEKKGLIEWSSTGNPRKIIYADEAQKAGRCMQDIWTFKDPPRPLYPTEKNLDMLKVIIEASSNPGDLVLDCFAGSGTTLLAAQQLNRRWIGIDSSEMAIQICESRLGVKAVQYGTS
ncbi:site-specific DNA-methyltransferase [bacterium]|nr:site-specific DNA-methyltransferase [bacterium]